MPRPQDNSEKPLCNHLGISNYRDNLAVRFVGTGHPHLLIFDIFNISCVVAIPLALVEHLEAPLAYAVNHRSAISKELDISDL